MKILVAEDEPKTGMYLQQGLLEAGFNVDRMVTGTEALHQALNESYDLLILDVMMPGIDGWEVIQSVRAAGSLVPVLFLTARDGVDDRVRGLELGADDYLVDSQGVCFAGTADAPQRGGSLKVAHRIPGLGYEFRQRYQRD